MSMIKVLVGKAVNRIRMANTHTRPIAITNAWALFCISFFVFEPLKSYLCNLSDYWFDFKEYLILIASAALLVFVGLLVVSLLICLFLPTSAKVISSYVFILTIGLYIQGNFIPNTIGILDGSPIEWSKINVGMVLSILLWVGIVVILVQITRKRVWKQLGKVICIVSPLLLLLEVVTIASLMVSHPDFANESDEYYMSSDEELKFSSDENFIILVLDCFDSTYFKDALDDDLKNALEGFTYYPDTSSIYGHTLCSLSQIITGAPFVNQTTYAEYEDKAFENSYLLNYLERNEWNMGIYADYTFHENSMLENCVNLKKTVPEINSKRKFYSDIYRIVAYNVVPYHLKQLFWFYPQLNELKGASADDKFEQYSINNESFYQDLANVEIVDSQPRFRMIHIEGMHTPYRTTSDVVNVADDVSLEETLEANYRIIERFVTSLKEAGIYDSSTVIIMSDHGGYDVVEGLKQNPLFMCKGIGENHPFEISESEFTYSNLDKVYESIFNSTSICRTIDSVASDERLFYHYGYDTMNEMVEYSIIGAAWDNTALKETGRKMVLKNE